MAMTNQLNKKCKYTLLSLTNLFISRFLHKQLKMLSVYMSIHEFLAVKFNLLKNTNHIIVIHQKVVWKMTITNYILIE
jgi:hypothetical protein